MNSIKHVQRRGFEAAGLLLAGAAYAGGLRLLGAGLTGAGHGTEFFYILSESPFGSGLFLWPAVGAVIPFRHKMAVFFLLCAALLLHYAGVIQWWFREAEFPVDGLAATWRSVPMLVVLTVVVYLLGQAFIWWRMIQRFRQSS